MNANLPIAKSGKDLFLLPGMANRHGLVAGATGTGKTVTLQGMAEGVQPDRRAGVPCRRQGRPRGLALPGAEKPKITERIQQLGLAPFPFEGYPVTFWDVFGQQGHPLRATVSEMGPLLLSRLLNLNDVQAGVLSIVFRVADDQGLLLLDLKDLRALLQHVGDNAAQYQTQYGQVAAASIGAIQRGLLELESQGGDKLFGEPALALADLIQTDLSGKGQINILAADRLMTAPKTYATLLLWVLSELFEQLPEVGDPEKPRLVFFFDEAHLLFNDAPSALLEKIEQVVRLVRSKGVGVYFVTQNPLDVPARVLAQLSNRVQHALRAFTPQDQRAVKAAAETFAANPAVDVETAITQLAVGEALVSFLDAAGRPTPVERAFVLPPRSQIGPLTPDQRQAVLRQSRLFGRYEQPLDRESAFEKLKTRAAQTLAAPRRRARPGPRPSGGRPV
jgi:DNA helicase HerA-like ATPase